VALNRPEVHNAFNEVMISEITACFAALGKDSAVRLAVLSGEGKSFSAGGDLEWMRTMKNFSREENIADARKLAEMYETLNDFPRPLIAKVHGVALGGGVGLVAVSDYVVAPKDASFGLTEVRLGLAPATIGPFVARKIGESAARATFFSGARFDAARAKEMGLAHEVAEPAALDAACEKAVEEFLKAGPQAAQETKALLKFLRTPHSAEEEKNATAQLIAKLRIGDEGQEGMAALLEKRKAKWVS
jgi:methylglutaconyl-CoA hydratase